MVARQWTTQQQAEFLESRKAAFLTARTENRLPTFFASVQHDFFVHWSERDRLFPSPATATDDEPRVLTSTEEAELQYHIAKKKKQIQSWFPWHCRASNPRKSAQSHLASFKASMRGAVRTRKLQEVEVYSSMYYKEKIKARVLEERGPNPLPRSESLRLIKRVTAEMWAQESMEVKVAVSRKMAELSAAAEEETKNATEDSGVPGLPTRSPSDFQRAINDLSPLLLEVLRALSDETGWAFTVFMGGPNPVAGGTIASASLHIGTSEVGTTFADSHPDWDARYMEDWIAWLRILFHRDVQQSRAIIGDTLSTKDDFPSSSSSNNSNLIDFPVIDPGPGRYRSGDADEPFPGQLSDPNDNYGTFSPAVTPAPTPPPTRASSPNPSVIHQPTSSSPTPAPAPTPTRASSPCDAEMTPVEHGPRIPDDSTPTIIVEKDAPAWVREAVAHMSADELGQDWMKCVKRWLDFEAMLMYGQGETNRLPTVGRPKEISYWQKRARKYTPTAIPAITNVSAFAGVWADWWKGMEVGSGQDGGVMRVGGCNGFLLNMLLMTWWGHAAVRSRLTSVDNPLQVWQSAVVDVSSALEKMMGKGKRKASSSPHSDLPTHKRVR